MENQITKLNEIVARFIELYKPQPDENGHYDIQHKNVSTVGLYISEKLGTDKPYKVERSYTSLKFRGYEVVFNNGDIYQIQFDSGNKSWNFDLPAWLDDIKRKLNQQEPLIEKPEQYAVETKTTVERVEVETKNHKAEAKAELLDELLGRGLTIGAK